MHEWTNQPLLQLPLSKYLDIHHLTLSGKLHRYSTLCFPICCIDPSVTQTYPSQKKKEKKKEKTPSPCETQSMLIKTSSSSTRTARTSTTDSPSSSRTRNTATRPAAPGLCVQSPRSAGGCFRACRFSSTRTGRRGIFRWMWLG